MDLVLLVVGFFLCFWSLLMAWPSRVIRVAMAISLLLLERSQTKPGKLVIAAPIISSSLSLIYRRDPTSPAADEATMEVDGELR